MHADKPSFQKVRMEFVNKAGKAQSIDIEFRTREAFELIGKLFDAGKLPCRAAFNSHQGRLLWQLLTSVMGLDKTATPNDWSEDLRVCGDVLKLVIERGGVLSSITFDDSREGVPPWLELLGFLFGGRFRREVFEPAYNDMLADHLRAQALRFQTPWTRRWIKCCLALRTVCLVLECAGVALRGVAYQLFLPQSIRDVILRWWNND
jgi:hypothetical protein